jgi:hypothetical protein
MATKGQNKSSSAAANNGGTGINASGEERKTRVPTMFRTQAVDTDGRIAIAVTVSGKENARAVFNTLKDYADRSEFTWDLTTTIQKDVNF